MTLAVFEEAFDSCPQAGEGGGPEFHTTIHVLGSGFERGNIDWSADKFRGDLGSKTVDEATKDYLVAFFRGRRGRAQAFLYKDWTDYRATDESVQWDGDLVVQLIKTYESGGNPYTREITKPKEGTVVIKVDGVVTADYEIDYTTGIVTFGTDIAPDTDNDVTWTGEFYIPVRFDTDHFRANPLIIRDNRATYQIGALPIVEKRV
jgi:uncharacterized protein (TIGR02217 family)